MPGRVRRTGFMRRRKFGDCDKPQFFQLEGDEIGEPITLEFLDWNAGETKDSTSGEQLLLIDLIEVAADSENALEIPQMTHVQVANLYYAFQGADRRVGTKRDWIVTCGRAVDRLKTGAAF